jgi:2-polyprenyl-6-methoxyphenol hydroxylase-like FAD-dependent oxidoreductase
MADTKQSYDAVIVGGSLAGCAAATMLGRAGARVAVVEKSPDPAAFKRICSHFIQASAVPTLERLDLVEPMVEAGAVCSRLRTRTPWGWVVPAPETAAVGIDLRRERLDPLVREMAASTPGVEVLLGQTVVELRRAGGAVRGVVARDREGVETTFEAPLTIGADGRDSLIAKLSGVKVKTFPHGRFAYGGYYEDMELASAPDVSMWMMNPAWAAAFPTDGGLTFCAAMPLKQHLDEFKADPAEALAAYFERLPETPSLRSARLVGDPGVIGKIDMTNRQRTPTAPGLALIGDAALATDPLFGVGCGWAFQSAEWLADAVAPALRGEAALEAGLRRYRTPGRSTTTRRVARCCRASAWSSPPRPVISGWRRSSTNSARVRSARPRCSRSARRWRWPSTPATRWDDAGAAGRRRACAAGRRARASGPARASEPGRLRMARPAPARAPAAPRAPEAAPDGDRGGRRRGPQAPPVGGRGLLPPG